MQQTCKELGLKSSLSPSLSLSHSDPHSVASLLVQQLLTHFSLAFLTPTSQTPAGQTSTSQTPTSQTSSSQTPASQGREEHSSLKEFLSQDTTVLLLLAIHIISQQVIITDVCLV